MRISQLPRGGKYVPLLRAEYEKEGTNGNLWYNTFLQPFNCTFGASLPHRNLVVAGTSSIIDGSIPQTSERLSALDCNVWHKKGLAPNQNAS